MFRRPFDRLVPRFGMLEVGACPLLPTSGILVAGFVQGSRLRLNVIDRVSACRCEMEEAALC